VVRIQPDGNTRLSGMYRSKDGYFTQCEAQGFRRITWFLDRPDVMSTYTVTLHADKATYPILLANGNPVATGDEANGRHWAKWADPFAKPAYLFALVAGKLDGCSTPSPPLPGARRPARHLRRTGQARPVPARDGRAEKIDALGRERFGLECDLDHYMIVAVGDFNMGAMENKGLNIFNTKYVLARPDVATDVDYQNIDRVVAHEYFHNWTGNRVTCRDWFQLSLKEGLTVFRDQEFGADTHNAPDRASSEVRGLRAGQFPEDAGPMAHPIRPASYVEINNFYTSTVYEKGAEVIRMIQTLIGRDGFRAGMDEYFQRHDGQAVTCEDFVAAMQDASDVDLTQFRRWYARAGTPRWEAGQRLATRVLLTGIAASGTGADWIPDAFVAACGRVLDDGLSRDPALAAEALNLPAEAVLAEAVVALGGTIDPEAIHTARVNLRRHLAAHLRDKFETVWAALAPTAAYAPDGAQVGQRALRNACLGYLAESDAGYLQTSVVPRLTAQLSAGNNGAGGNMTDEIAALATLANLDLPEREAALANFYTRWQTEALVVDKWFSVQATSRLPGTAARVRALMQHPAFDLKNPNRVYALIRGFCGANPRHFHAADGSGYALAADVISELQAMNPQVASRIARSFDRWRQFDTGRQAHARAALERIAAVDGLAKDVAEVVGNALKA
jgi:aminopeptidase N